LQENPHGRDHAEDEVMQEMASENLDIAETAALG
jgi:hypothetical protein